MQNFPVDQIIQNSSCIGLTIQNSEGLAIASLAQRLKQAYKAVEIEAMAAIRALEFAAEISWTELW